MEIFDVFSMNGIENYPAAGEFFLENVIHKVSQTHFSKDFYAKGGAYIFQGGQCRPLGGGGGGGCEVPWSLVIGTYFEYNVLLLGILPTAQSLAQCEKVSVSSFCRRRLPVILVRLRMAQSVSVQ